MRFHESVSSEVMAMDQNHGTDEYNKITGEMSFPAEMVPEGLTTYPPLEWSTYPPLEWSFEQSASGIPEYLSLTCQ
jgi:hypothetical protein